MKSVLERKLPTAVYDAWEVRNLIGVLTPYDGNVIHEVLQKSDQFQVLSGLLPEDWFEDSEWAWSLENDRTIHEDLIPKEIVLNMDCQLEYLLRCTHHSVEVICTILRAESTYMCALGIVDEVAIDAWDSEHWIHFRAKERGRGHGK